MVTIDVTLVIVTLVPVQQCQKIQCPMNEYVTIAWYDNLTHLRVSSYWVGTVYSTKQYKAESFASVAYL